MDNELIPELKKVMEKNGWAVSLEDSELILSCIRKAENNLSN